MKKLSNGLIILKMVQFVKMPVKSSQQIPLVHFIGYVGFEIWSMIAIVSIYYAIRVEKYKKNFNIQTILAGGILYNDSQRENL